MKIAMDIDGVIADSEPAILQVGEEEGYELNILQYIPFVKIINGETIKDEEERRQITINIVHKLYEEKMDIIKLYPTAALNCKLINQYLGPITYVTAREPQFNDKTLTWLNNYLDFSFAFINRFSKEKAQFILEEDFDIFIEDRLRTANESAELGIRTYLINRKWNINRYTHKDIIRINSLAEVIILEKDRIIKEMTNE